MTTSAQTRRRRRRWPWIVGITAAVLVLAAIGAAIGGDSEEPQQVVAPTPTPAVDQADPEQAYLDAVVDAGTAAGRGVHALGDDSLLRIGYGVCDDLDAGHAPTDVVRQLEQVDGPVGDNAVATAIVGNAQLYLCDPDD